MFCSICLSSHMNNCLRTPESSSVWKELLLFNKEPLHWSLTAIASPEHTRRVEAIHLQVCCYLAGTDWSKRLLKQCVDISFGALLQLFTLYIPTCTHFSLKHSHYAKITEPREFRSLTAPCAKISPTLDSEPFKLDLIISINLCCA